jgi:beta propeller repeat protein
MKDRIIFLALVVGLVALITGMLPVAPALALVGTEVQITTNTADQSDPAISGSYIVYTSNQNGNQDIYLHDLTSGIDIDLTPGTPNDQYLDDVDGNYVVYTSVTVSGSNIHLFDVWTSSLVPLTVGGSNYSPAVEGDHVVWVSGSVTARNIMLADVSAWSLTKVSQDPDAAEVPRVDGDWVVWDEVVSTACGDGLCYGESYLSCPDDCGTTDPVCGDGICSGYERRSNCAKDCPFEYCGDGECTEHERCYTCSEDCGTCQSPISWQIKAYQISNGETRTLTTDAANHLRPDISGNLVVWADDRNGNWDIYSYDLDSSITTQLTFDPADQLYPRISGRRIVWEDGRGAVTQIWSEDLDEGLEEPVSPSSNPQFLSAIDGNRIVWTESRYGNFDIFMFTIENPPAPYCGDTICNGAETCSSCPGDCGTCPPPEPYCGDTICNGGETCSSCPGDCGICPPPEPFCGDTICNGAETCESCPGDCGICPPPEPFCGDTICNGAETCESCPGDCGICPPPYEIEGFYSPIDNLVVNIANAGKTIPVKWHLSETNGYVDNPASFTGLLSYPVSCSEFSGNPTDSVEEYSTGTSGLQYSGNGYWQYNWKTSKSYAGTCRKMYVAFDTGQISPVVSFRFK